MLRKTLPILLLWGIAAGSAQAQGVAVGPAPNQEWAVRMFNTTRHDFGPVPRGTKAQYTFKIKNIYEQDIHISGVRSTCNCTSPQIVKPDLKTFDVGEIVAEFNTRQFIGQKSAVLTVTFDKPTYAEVQLQVSGFIRSDVVLQPGEIDFGNVDLGTSAERRVQITYNGREDWGLTDARSNDPNLRLQLVDLGRGRGHANYELVVRLTRHAPAGYIKEQITLVTNDTHNPEIPVDVEGRVVSEIMISPASLFMGVVQPGQKVPKQLMVRGKRPFKIVGVKCDDASFEVETGDESLTVHKLQVVFTAGDREGKVSQQIALETDQGASPTFTAFAQVVASSALPTPTTRTEKHDLAKRSEKGDLAKGETSKADWVKANRPKGEATKKGADGEDVEAILQLNVEPDSPDEQ